MTPAAQPHGMALNHAAASDALDDTPPPSGLQLLGRIASHAWQQARAEGWADGLRVLIGAARMLAQRDGVAELFAIPAYARLMAAQPQADLLFFANHRHFLSRGFCRALRLACALDHFRYEQRHFSPGLLRALHGDGLALWRAGEDWEIRLRANAQTRHEGPLSLLLRHDGRTVHELSFGWVEAQRLGHDAGSGPVLFVTRNQSSRPDAPALARFRATFPQNSPAYFALAALNGVAQALALPRIVGVCGVCQIAYEPGYRAGFQRSYDDFWQGFGGKPLGSHGLAMPVPAAVTPLHELPAKHRARARQRREHWCRIAAAAEAGLKPWLRG